MRDISGQRSQTCEMSSTESCERTVSSEPRSIRLLALPPIWPVSVSRHVVQVDFHTLIEVTFITYGLLGNELDAETIFSALQYFQVLRFAFALMPVQFGAMMDCLSAVCECHVVVKLMDSSNFRDVLGEYRYREFSTHFSLKNCPPKSTSFEIVSTRST